MHSSSSRAEYSAALLRPENHWEQGSRVTEVELVRRLKLFLARDAALLPRRAADMPVSEPTTPATAKRIHAPQDWTVEKDRAEFQSRFLPQPTALVAASFHEARA